MRPTPFQHRSIGYLFPILFSLFVTGIFPNSAAAQVLSGTWSPTASMASARGGASAVLLQHVRFHADRHHGGGGADKFRIKIWDPSGVIVYDNQLGLNDDGDPTTMLGGGSIVVHK